MTLNAHQIRHEDRKFHCSKCGKSYPQFNELKYHELTHTGPRVCPHCKHVCKTSFGLKRHIAQVHSLGNTKICNECGQSFYGNYQLKEHMNVHLKHPAQTCSLCEKTFCKPYALKIHLKSVHQNIKDFSCDYCEFKAFNAHKVNIHQARKHENFTETCFICQNKTKSIYHHIKYTHKELPDAWEDYKRVKKLKELSKLENNSS